MKIYFSIHCPVFVSYSVVAFLMSTCINEINLLAQCSIRRVSGIFWLIPSFLYPAKNRMINSIFISKIQFCEEWVWASLYKVMEASLKKQLIEVFRIEDSQHVVRLPKSWSTSRDNPSYYKYESTTDFFITKKPGIDSSWIQFLSFYSYWWQNESNWNQYQRIDSRDFLSNDSKIALDLPRMTKNCERNLWYSQ